MRQKLTRAPHVALAGAFILLCLHSACSGSSPEDPPANSDECGNLPAVTAPIALPAPVDFCWSRQANPLQGKVQILLDSSGSMAGFETEGQLPKLSNWVQQAASRLRGAILNYSQVDLRHFNARDGVQSWRPAGSIFSNGPPFPNTNLHEAIRSSENCELTFIITDGIAATGAGSKGDCAGNVDAACVARAMQEAVHAMGGGRGIWIMPVRLRFKGTFFSEQSWDQQTEDAIKNTETFRKTARSVIGEPATVQDVSKAGDSTLKYSYDGRRPLLVMIIAATADLGRAAAEALWNAAPLNGIRMLERLGDTDSAFGVLPPIEVFPGFYPSIEWTGECQPLDPQYPDSHRWGNIDISMPVANRLAISCEKEAQDCIVLTSRSKNCRDQTTSRAPIYQIVPFQLRWEAQIGADPGALAGVYRGMGVQEEYPLRLVLHLQDSGTLKGPANIRAELKTRSFYTEAANRMHSIPDLAHQSDKQGEALGKPHLDQYLQDLSTAKPAFEPFRIMGLASFLELFYQYVAQDQQEMTIGEIEFAYAPYK